jgi:crotonobetainyl-CoA:carnitine CoA-transferase CaiB-like acyl-CoA transferase
MNRFVWDMQYEPAEKIEGMVLWNGVPGGPKAAPGRYTAVVKCGRDSMAVPVMIKGDPNYKVSDEQYQEQVAFLLSVRDKFNDIQKAVKNIRSLRSQISEFTGKADTADVKSIRQLGDSISKQLTVIEEALYQTKAKAGQDILNYPMRLNDRMAALYNVAASGNNAPTRQVKDAFGELCTEVDGQLGKLKKIQEIELKALNKLILDKRVEVIGVKNQ